MIKINRVGNKLGLAGLVGILLSVGVVANQMRTETAISEVDQLADVQQKIADSALEAEGQIRSMRIASQALRMAITTPEIDRNAAEIRAGKVAQDGIINSASALATRQDYKENFAKIKALTSIYVAAADEIAGLQKKLLELYRNRNVAVID